MPASFSTELHIDAAPERVFAAMTNIEGYGSWMQGFVGAKKLTDGPFGVGTEWKETRKMFGKEASEVFEVTGCDAPARLDLRVDGSRGASRKGEYRFTYELVPEPQGTRVRMNGEVHMPGLLGKLMSKLFVGMFKKACDKDLVAMKAYVEARA